MTIVILPDRDIPSDASATTTTPITTTPASNSNLNSTPNDTRPSNYFGTIVLSSPRTSLIPKQIQAFLSSVLAIQHLPDPKSPFALIREAPVWAMFPVLLYLIHLAIGENGIAKEGMIEENACEEEKIAESVDTKVVSSDLEPRESTGTERVQPEDTGDGHIKPESALGSIGNITCGAWSLHEVVEETRRVLLGLADLCHLELLEVSDTDGEHVDYKPKIQPTRTKEDVDLPLSANLKEV